MSGSNLISIIRATAADPQTMNYETTVVLDLETGVQVMLGGAFDPMPYGPKAPPILLCGTRRGNLTHITTDLTALTNVKIATLVGHNLKFDLQHLRRAKHDPTKGSVCVWDTMIAEYILTGQITKFASLDSLAKRYLGTTKRDLIGESLALGITPDRIPVADLKAYLAEDLSLTQAIARAQWVIATTAQRELILIHGGALVAYAHMEFNGLTIDKAKTIERRDEAAWEAEVARDTIVRMWHSVLGSRGCLPPWWHSIYPLELAQALST
ncbi:MAG TPA: hypothetical protein VE222_04610, partial [Nitrospiraceae bacterium]|nr:hypothetical protein [Nitrospiraceae bacterium]